MDDFLTLDSAADLSLIVDASVAPEELSRITFSLSGCLSTVLGRMDNRLLLLGVDGFKDTNESLIVSSGALLAELTVVEPEGLLDSCVSIRETLLLLLGVRGVTSDNELLAATLALLLDRDGISDFVGFAFTLWSVELIDDRLESTADFLAFVDDARLLRRLELISNTDWLSAVLLLRVAFVSSSFMVLTLGTA